MTRPLFFSSLWVAASLLQYTAHAIISCTGSDVVPAELQGGGRAIGGSAGVLVAAALSPVEATLQFTDGTRLEACLTSTLQAGAFVVAGGAACMATSLNATSSSLLLTIAPWPPQQQQPSTCSSAPPALSVPLAFSPDAVIASAAGCPALPISAFPASLLLPAPALAASAAFPPAPNPALITSFVDAAVGVSPSGLFLSHSGVRLDYCAGSITPLSTLDGGGGGGTGVQVVTAAAPGATPLCYWLRRGGEDGCTLQYRFGQLPVFNTTGSSGSSGGSSGGAAGSGVNVNGTARCPTSWDVGSDDENDDASHASDDGVGSSVVSIPAAYPDAPPSPTPAPSSSPRFSISGATPALLSATQPTVLTVLGAEERVEELARMLAGVEVTGSAREHARQLLSRPPATAARKKRS